MATGKDAVDKRRLRVLARQVMIGGKFLQLQVVTVENGNVIIESFERETAATRFIDAPLAVLQAARTDDLMIDILNSIDSFDSLVKFIREAGLCVTHSGLQGVVVSLEAGNVRCLKQLL